MALTRFPKAISESQALIQWLDGKIDGLEVASDLRHRAAGGCFDIALELQKAIVVLVEKQLYGAAFALMRTQFEAYVRGVWIFKCAKDTQIEKFANARVGSIRQLVEEIEKLEGFQDGVLSKMIHGKWDILNDFTHTGFQQVVRRQKELSIEPNYDDAEIIDAVNFADAIGCLSAIAICGMANNLEISAKILEKLRRNGLINTITRA